tara:strand:- start:335 stop:856 length:522 start_codon:yes stop_codon:yes gene_type:complete
MRDVENFGSLQLPLGGVHGYIGVRKARDGKFQGYTPRKTRTTAAFETPHEAAVALALKRQQVEFDVDGDESAEHEQRPRGKRKRRTCCAPALGRLTSRMIPFLKEGLFGSCVCTAVALEPLTEQQSMARKSFEGSPTSASDSVGVMSAVAPAVWPQRSAPVVAQVCSPLSKQR